MCFLSLYNKKQKKNPTTQAVLTTLSHVVLRLPPSGSLKCNRWVYKAVKSTNSGQVLAQMFCERYAVNKDMSLFTWAKSPFILQQIITFNAECKRDFENSNQLHKKILNLYQVRKIKMMETMYRRSKIQNLIRWELKKTLLKSFVLLFHPLCRVSVKSTL